MIGFPRSVGAPWAVTRGGIVGRKGKAIVFSGAVDPGNSGGPLVKDDQVVGVITQAQGQYAYASPSLIVQYALESWGVRFGVYLRSTPMRLHESELLRIFKVKGFNHPATRILTDWASKYRPTESVFGHFRHEYEVKSLNGAGVIIDHATRLMWHQTVSPKLAVDKQSAYVAELNRSHNAGFADWRLPTLEELMSLIEARADSHQLFVDPVFDAPQEDFISADTIMLDPDLSWRYVGVNFFLGALFVGTSPSHVRAVRSLKADELRSRSSPATK